MSAGPAAKSSAVLDFCRADKAALDRLRYLATHTTMREKAIARDPAYRMHNRAAGHFWRRLPPTMRAAVLNPNAREG